MNTEKLIGVEGIKSLFEKTLHNNEKVLRTVLTGRPLVYLAGEKFSEEYMTKRNEAGVFLKSLRILDDIDLPHHKTYSKLNKEVRTIPNDVKICDSIVIWDDFVATVNAEKLSCTLVQDPENAKNMKEWFDSIWAKSKKEE